MQVTARKQSPLDSVVASSSYNLTSCNTKEVAKVTNIGGFKTLCRRLHLNPIVLLKSFMSLEAPRLQRLFSTFPARWPGLGLFLLRALVGCSLIIHGARYFQGWPNVDLSNAVVGTLTTTAGVSLLTGFMTPVVSVMVILGGLARMISLLPPPSASNVGSLFSILNIVIVAASLAFLGPGAFSLDARIFGRREIKIPSYPGHKS